MRPRDKIVNIQVFSIARFYLNLDIPIKLHFLERRNVSFDRLGNGMADERD